MADIDELKFSIILDDNKFKQKMEEVNAAAEKFEKSVKAALAVQNLLDAAQSKGVKSAEQKAQSAEKAASAAKKEAAAMGEQEKEEEKVYKLVELRRKRKEQSGQLTQDEVQVLKQMESIEKALLNIREQHKGELAEEFSIMMNKEGMTRQQVGSYQSLVTQMQAATSESAKREAAEKAALTLREQKENAILALNRTLAGVNQELLSAETQIAIQKGLSGELTAKEIASLQTVIATENKRIAAQKKADAEKQAAETALIGLRRTLVGINQKILSEEVKQKIAKAEAGQLTSKEISQLNEQIALERAKANEQERQRAAAVSISSQLTRQTSLMRGLTSYVAQYASVFGAATILRNLIRITGEFEAQHVALRAILQDSIAADNIYNQLQVLAVKSPYTFQNLVSYAKQLTAFSVPVNEVYETTKKLADVSAGLGVDMGRIILAYGQVRSAEFLRGQEVRQFTEAGIPILAELAKQFSEIEGHAISVGEVFNRISARQVPFAMVEEAFNRMTSAGGKFYNMQEVLAETVKGKISNLQDAWEIMLSKIGNENSGTIKGIVTMLTGLFANYEKWIGYVSAVVKGLGAYAAAMAITNGITKAANAYQALNNSLQIVKNAQLKLSTILIPTANAVQKTAIANNMEEAATLATLNAARKAALGILGLVVTVIALVAQKFRGMRKENEALSRSMDELTRSYRENLTLFSDGWNTLEKVHEQFKDGKKTAKDYKDALNDLYEKFPNFIDENVRQKIAVEDLAGAWDAATQNMKQYYAENASHQAHEILLKGYKEEANKIVEDLNAQLRTGRKFKQYRRNGLINEGSIQLLDAYVMGLRNKDELSEDLQRLVELLNRTGARTQFTVDEEGVERAVIVYDNIIDKARDRYLAATQEFREAVNKADADIEKDFTSTRHRQVREYLLGIGVAEDSELMMREGEDEFESWQSWQERLRMRYEEMGKENKKVVSKMFDHFGLVVSADGLTPAQSAISEWMKKNPAPSGVSMAGFEIKPETNVAEFAENALKQMQDDAKALARLPKEFQKTEEQGWDEYAKMLKAKGETTSANLALRVQYFEKMSQAIWEDDVFGSSKELLKKEKQSEKSWDKLCDDKIAALKLRQQRIEEIRKQYEAFKPYMNKSDDTTIKGILFGEAGLFPTETDEALKSTLDFDAALLRVADDMEKYGEKGAEAARKIREEFELAAAKAKAEEMLKSYKDSAAALEKVQGILDKIAENIKDVNGENLQLKVNVIRDDLDRKNRKTDAEATEQRNTILAGEKAYRELHREEGDIEALWTTYRDNALAAVDAWAEAEKQANRDIAQQRIKELGSNFVQNWLRDKKGLSLDRLDKKSLKELNDILAALGELTDAEVMSLIPDGDKEKAEALKLVIEDILKKIKEARDEQEEIVDAKKWEKIEKSLTSLASAAKSLGDALSGLGGAGEVLGDAVSAIGEFASSYASIQKSIKEGDTAGIAATAITSIAGLISSVADNIKENKKAQEEWELTVLSTDLAYRRLMLDRMDYEESNVFGVESPFAKAKSAVGQYKAAKAELDSIVGELGNGQVQTGTKKEAVSAWGDIGKGAAAGAALGSIIPGVGTVLGAVTGSVIGMITGAFKRKTVPVFESLKEQYGELYDSETYELNPRIIADYDKLDDKTKEIVDHWDEIKEKMVEAQKAIEETISELAGEMGNELRDSLVDAFRNDDLYSAIDNFHDYVTGVLEDLMAQAVFAAVFEEKFKQLQEDLENSSDIKGEEGNGKTWVSIIAEFIAGLTEGIKKVGGGLKVAQEEAEKYGFSLYRPDGDDSSLGNGFKSITEDTANLLASYLNAIRADVSYGRIQWGRVADAVEGQSALCITLNEYLAKVQADTANIAASNQEILNSLNGFVRNFSMASGYGDSLKVQIVN